MLYQVGANDPVKAQQPAPGKLLAEIKYPNILFKSLKDIMENFLVHDTGDLGIGRPTVAVLAIAGVVTNNECRYTNLDWIVKGSELSAALDIPQVEVINDFVAQGYGCLTLGDHEVERMNEAVPQPSAPKVCVGAGTGLGECFLLPEADGNYRCFPSEGGHCEFPPRDMGSEEEQIELLQHLKVKFSGWNRVSVERVVSGKGICNVYEFLAYKYPHLVDKAVHREVIGTPADAGVIAKHAKPGSLCEKAFKIFASCYGAQAGTVALHFMPFGGLYLSGGVTQKNAELLLRDDSFLSAYFDKGRVSPLLDRVPLFLVKSDDMGQRGAHLRAVQLLKAHLQNIPIRFEAEMEMEPEQLVEPRELWTEMSDGEPGLAQQLQEDIQEFRNRSMMERKSRRMRIPDGDEAADYEPGEIRGIIWKVLRNGRRSEDGPENWLERDVWIAKNGSLVYYSVAEGRNLVVWTPGDLATASITALPEDAAVKPWAFQIHPANREGVVFGPSTFACRSSEERDLWLSKLEETQQRLQLSSTP